VRPHQAGRQRGQAVGAKQRSLWRTVGELEDSSQLFVLCRRWSTPAVLEVDEKMLGDPRSLGERAEAQPLSFSLSSKRQCCRRASGGPKRSAVALPHQAHRTELKSSLRAAKRCAFLTVSGWHR
jgi:hypothetical protein